MKKQIRIKKGVVVLDMAVTISDSHNSSLRIEKILLDQPGVILHLIASKLNNDYRDCQANAEIIVFSVDVLNEKTWGPVSLNTSNLEVGYDLTDVVHTKMYYGNILGLDSMSHDKADEKIWNNRQQTKYCSSLSYDDYRKVLNLLLEEHKERVLARSANPRKDRSEETSDDLLDKCLSRIFKRITCILNDGLYWGHLYSLPFGDSKTVEMRTYLR